MSACFSAAPYRGHRVIALMRAAGTVTDLGPPETARLSAVPPRNALAPAPTAARAAPLV
jgi:hypothetical protein